MKPLTISCNMCGLEPTSSLMARSVGEKKHQIVWALPDNVSPHMKWWNLMLPTIFFFAKPLTHITTRALLLWTMFALKEMIFGFSSRMKFDYTFACWAPTVSQHLTKHWQNQGYDSMANKEFPTSPHKQFEIRWPGVYWRERAYNSTNHSKQLCLPKNLRKGSV